MPRCMVKLWQAVRMLALHLKGKGTHDAALEAKDLLLQVLFHFDRHVMQHFRIQMRRSFPCNTFCSHCNGKSRKAAAANRSLKLWIHCGTHGMHYRNSGGDLSIPYLFSGLFLGNRHRQLMHFAAVSNSKRRYYANSIFSASNQAFVH